jgi:hypothetical protein
MLCGLTETTTAGDVPPVMAAPPGLVNPALAAKRKIPTGTKKKDMRGRMASRLIGEDSRDGFVIPDDAKEVDSMEVTGDGLTNIKTPTLPGDKPKNPYSGEEPLILPAASLVAPDVTPEALYPLDPSQLPGSDAGKSPESAPTSPSAMPSPIAGASPRFPGMPGAQTTSAALDVVLGKGPGMAPESMLSRLPGIPAPGQVAAMEASVPAGEATLSQGQPMPEHKTVEPARVMDAFSQFVPRGSMKPRGLNG